MRQRTTKSLSLPLTGLALTTLAVALIAGGLAGCSRRKPDSTPAAPQSITLSAVLLSPTDVKLTWKDPAPNAAGHIVEYATEPQGEFTTLGFFPPDQNTFTHPNLMPETNWYYRVRAYYGPVSDPVEVALPDALSDKEYARRFARPEDFSWAVPKTIPVPDGVPVAKLSIRNAESAAQAAPTDLKAVLVPSTVSGFRLTWSNHASDEDGYLLEMKPQQSSDFAVRAALERGINSFGYAFEPPERRATLRVRAFFYGQPSNMAHATTGRGQSN
ncbi:MAG TPA: hypothetical protein VFA71_03575 [Terriglobales bacterium]|nr:hypothetical protein [Terriglobales bacterium]